MQRTCANCHSDVDAVSESGLCLKCAASLSRLPIETPSDGRESTLAKSCATESWRSDEKSGAAPSSITLPRAIGRYVLEGLIGEGGFGTLYQGRDTLLLRQVAIKAARPVRLDSRARFEHLLDEARSAARLKHPGIVPVHDVFEDGEGGLFIAMELVEGRSLHEIAKQDALLPVETIVDTMAQVADAIHHAHTQEIVHRDLTPANILVTASGRALVTDFGLSVNEVSQYQQIGQVAGTPAYMSPEQVRGDTHRLDGRADVWSMGVIVYQLLTGRLPFRGNRQATFDEILNREPRPPRQIRDAIPAHLEAICLRCLEKDAAKRYRTAKDLADDLRAWRQNGSAPTIGSEPTSPHRRSLQPPRIHPAFMALLVLMLLGAAAATIGAFRLKPMTNEPFPDRGAAKPVVAAPQRFAPNKWHDLFREKPVPLAWPVFEKTARWDLDEGAEQLWINSTSLALLPLANVAKNTFTLEIKLSKATWSGFAGVFWGATDPMFTIGTNEVLLNAIVCRGVSRLEEGRQLYLGRYHLACTKTARSIESSTREAAPAVPIDVPGPGEHALSITVSGGRVTQVVWRGAPIRDLVDVNRPSTQNLSSGDIVGVLSFQGSTTFSDAKLFVSGD